MCAIEKAEVRRAFRPTSHVLTSRVGHDAISRTGTLPLNARTPHLSTGDRSCPHSQLANFPGNTRGRKRDITVQLYPRQGRKPTQQNPSVSVHQQPVQPSAVVNTNSRSSISPVKTEIVAGKPARNGSAADRWKLNGAVGESPPIVQQTHQQRQLNLL